jgi:hypothetical protein
MTHRLRITVIKNRKGEKTGEKPAKSGNNPGNRAGNLGEFVAGCWQVRKDKGRLASAMIWDKPE